MEKTMNLTEKAAYLKGLMDGMNFDKNTNEGKLIAGIIDMMDDLALSVTDLEDSGNRYGYRNRNGLCYDGNVHAGRI